MISEEAKALACEELGKSLMKVTVEGVEPEI
jgi:hypothetical protein